MQFADPREPAVVGDAQWTRSWPVRYGFALLAVITAAVFQFSLRNFGLSHFPYLLYFPTVVLVAALAGFGPGVVATVLATIAGAYPLLAPSNSSAIRSPEDLPKAVLFLVIGLFFSSLARSRERVDNALKESETDLNRAQAMAHIGSWRLDIAAGKVLLSHEACRILGLSLVTEVSLLQARQLVHPADIECLEIAWNGTLTTRGYDQETRVLVNGQTRWVRIQANLERNTQGLALKAVGTLQDITERKGAEAALHESEDRYRDLVENSEDLLCTHDLEGTLLTVNPAPARILGYSVEELLKIPMRELIVPEGRTSFDAYLERLKTTGQPESGLLYVMTKSGEVRTWEYYNTLRIDGVKTPIVRGMAHDITERKTAELALQGSEERYRTLFEKAVAGVAIIALDGRVIDCNDAWAHMFGYRNAAECRNTQITDRYPDPSQREVWLSELLRNGAALNGELELRRQDGTLLWVLFNSILLTDGQSQPLIQSTIFDITARKLADDALLRNEERFRVALKDSPVTVFNQDRDLRYTWVYNPPSDWPSDVIGKSCEEVVGAKNAALVNELKQRVLETGQRLRAELTFSNHRSFDVTLEPLTDSAGKIVGITGSLMDVARLRELVDRLEEQTGRLAREKSYLQGEIESELGFEEIIGQSPALLDVLKKARVVAPTNSTVLLLGETGTGKELVARALHTLSPRRERSFIKLNCAAVPSGLLESELFGHEKGAFTSAVNQKVGRLELADGGTLFLDEVGELPPELQPKLLRVLQDREFERLGGVRTLRVDVRIISATNRDLHRDAAEKRFREDLFYRLNVFPIRLPTLRERKSDIPMLVSHFVHKYTVRMGKHIETIPQETMHVLQNWNWPGNVRELENMIERMVILSQGHTLAPPPAELEGAFAFTEDSLAEMEREHILRVLRETRGVLSGTDGAATRLGIKRTTLQSMLKRFGIEPREYRNQTRTFGAQ
jgi:formate hydrogenlyase transcriptional activator